MIDLKTILLFKLSPTKIGDRKRNRNPDFDNDVFDRAVVMSDSGFKVQKID